MSRSRAGGPTLRTSSRPSARSTAYTAAKLPSVNSWYRTTSAASPSPWRATARTSAAPKSRLVAMRTGRIRSLTFPSVPAVRSAAGRLVRCRQVGDLPDRHRHRLARLDGHPLALVVEVHGLAVEQLVRRRLGVDVDPQPAGAPGPREPQPAQRTGQVRREAQDVPPVPHAPPPRAPGRPGARP